MHGPDFSEREIPVIALSRAQSEGVVWGRSRLIVYAWGLVEWLLVTNALQISSRIRVAALRAFGATIGERVIFRPRTRVRFPWKLTIGNDVWIGEGVWIHNQDHVTIGGDVVVSQETLLTTGSHRHRVDMALVTSPITIEDGAWVTSRCIITGGVTIGRSALVAPMSVVTTSVPPADMVRGNPAIRFAERFDRKPQ